MLGWIGLVSAVYAAPCAANGDALSCTSGPVAATLLTVVAGAYDAYPECATGSFGGTERVHRFTCDVPSLVRFDVGGECALRVVGVPGATCDTDGCVGAVDVAANDTVSVSLPCTPGVGGHVIVEQGPAGSFASPCATDLQWSYTITPSCADAASPVLTGPSPLVAGLSQPVQVTGASPLAEVWLVVGGAPGTTAVPGCPGASVDLATPVLVATATADASGAVAIPVVPPLFSAGRPWGFHAIDVSSCAVSPLAVVDITR